MSEFSIHLLELALFVALSINVTDDRGKFFLAIVQLFQKNDEFLFQIPLLNLKLDSNLNLNFEKSKKRFWLKNQVEK